MNTRLRLIILSVSFVLILIYGYWTGSPWLRGSKEQVSQNIVILHLQQDGYQVQWHNGSAKFSLQEKTRLIEHYTALTQSNTSLRSIVYYHKTIPFTQVTELTQELLRAGAGEIDIVTWDDAATEKAPANK